MSKGNIRSANFDLNGLWSPWYTLHKTFAGLRDAYRHTGNQTALEIEIEVRAVGRDATSRRWTTRRSSGCSPREFGGMNEMMADLYADTGDKRWLDLSYQLRAQGRARSAEARRGSAQRPARQHAGAEADRLGGALRLRRRQGRPAPPRRSSGIASSTTTPSPPAATARTNTSASPTGWATSPTAAPPRPATSTTC